VEREGKVCVRRERISGMEGVEVVGGGEEVVRRDRKEMRIEEIRAGGERSRGGKGEWSGGEGGGKGEGVGGE